ncbi:MAG TPA: peptidoglycan-binding protein [Polyangiales bacterium]|nr:peptidoglycan-binding protein [Polyangiales bacterium]
MSQALKSGGRGDAVLALQQELAKLGFEVQPDGVFGPSTRASVEELQALFGQDIDGMVGAETHELIVEQTELGFDVRDATSVKDALASYGSATSLNRVLRQGTEGADVRFLQRRLVTLGYPLKIDAKFGPATEKAVRSLQEAFGYDVDGAAGEATHNLLNQQIGLGWSAKKPAP